MLPRPELSAMPSMIRACMSQQEYEAWEAANRLVRRGAPSPCIDCPTWFAAEMRELGRCDGEPGGQLRASTVLLRESRLPFARYANDEDRRAARRKQWRDSKRRARVASTGR